MSKPQKKDLSRFAVKLSHKSAGILEEAADLEYESLQRHLRDLKKIRVEVLSDMPEDDVRRSTFQNQMDAAEDIFVDLKKRIEKEKYDGFGTRVRDLVKVLNTASGLLKVLGVMWTSSYIHS